MALQEFVGPCIDFLLLIHGAIGEFLSAFRIGCLLHHSAYHAQRGLKWHRFGVILVYFGGWNRTLDFGIHQVTRFRHRCGDVHAHGTVHDHNHWNGPSNHQLVKVHGK